MQIRVRLTLQFLMIVTGILLAAFFIIKFQFKRNLEEEYYKRLKSNAYFIADMMVGDLTAEQDLLAENPTELANTLRGYYPENVSIYNLEGQLLFTLNSPAIEIDSSQISFAQLNGQCRFVQGGYISMGVHFTNKARNKFIVVVESYFDRVYIANLTQILAYVFLLAIALVAIGGWLFARQALAPVSRIMNQVDALLPTDISKRLEPMNQYDELSRLVITFNKLLDRLQKVFQVQKMFMSNISHELKNPLNVITSQVEVTLQKERSNEEYKETLSSVLADVKELNEIGEKLMQMAQINAEDAIIRFEPLRIDEVIWAAKDGLKKTHPEYKINFEIVNLPELEEKVYIHGNEKLLKTALVNLMDNGCKFSPDKDVNVQLSFSRDEIPIIQISDKGPGIPEEEITLVFNAFYRSAATSMVKGSGIGLSLVDSILKLHHVDLQVSSKAGEGTTFTLRFPLMDPKP